MIKIIKIIKSMVRFHVLIRLIKLVFSLEDNIS